MSPSTVSKSTAVFTRAYLKVVQEPGLESVSLASAQRSMRVTKREKHKLYKMTEEGAGFCHDS